jgi:hypothetical protein
VTFFQGSGCLLAAAYKRLTQEAATMEWIFWLFDIIIGQL